MRYLIRLRVFLLCCLLMIGLNVMLIVGGFISADSTGKVPESLSVCVNY